MWGRSIDQRSGAVLGERAHRGVENGRCLSRKVLCEPGRDTADRAAQGQELASVDVVEGHAPTPTRARSPRSAGAVFLNIPRPTSMSRRAMEHRAADDDTSRGGGE